MAQNIYDNDEFFAGYARLPRSVAGLEGAPEWPALRALLPDLRGRRVLDLGCGYGWFCRWAREAGAAEVLGIELSEKMLARARADTRDAAIAYQRADMESLALPGETFDLAYSSLALHYVENLNRLMSQAYEASRAGAWCFRPNTRFIAHRPSRNGRSIAPGARSGRSTITSTRVRARPTGWHRASSG